MRSPGHRHPHRESTPAPGSDDAHSASQLTVRSFAKLNPFLEVLGRRPDGYHELDTVMLKTSLCDVMTFTETEDDSIEIRLSPDSDPIAADGFPCSSDNLIWRAADSLRKFAAVRRGVQVNVSKRIPSGAGFGGGSGNAAAALQALNRLWGVDITTKQLHELAAGLGSDLNFLLQGSSAARCSGRGEVIHPVPVGGILYAVCFRGRNVNQTGAVFRLLHSDDEPVSAESPASLINALADADLPSLQAHLFNRLTTPACRHNSEMADLMHAARKITGSVPAMTGSGAGCFLLSRSAREAACTAARLSANGFPWVRVCRVASDAARRRTPAEGRR